jgi:hypothetical protein
MTSDQPLESKQRNVRAFVDEAASRRGSLLKLGHGSSARQVRTRRDRALQLPPGGTARPRRVPDQSASQRPSERSRAA